MCGICYLLKGIPIQNHRFTFDFFADYLRSDHIDKTIENLPLNEHVMRENLLLEDFDLREVRRICSRGPDKFECLFVDRQGGCLKVQPEKLEGLKPGEALFCQSILKLRGQNEQPCLQKPLGRLLYNGQIYISAKTLSPQPFQSDTTFLQHLLDSIPEQSLNAGTVAKLLRQMRGDFAFLYSRNDKIFLAKDEFGKKSLLVGFGRDAMVVSSVPVGNWEVTKEAKEGEILEEEEKGEDWKTKYKAEWLASKAKKYFEVPKNMVVQVTIDRQKGTAVWVKEEIYENWFGRSALEVKTQKTVGQVVRELAEILQESVKELVSNIGAYEPYFWKPQKQPLKQPQQFPMPQPPSPNSHIAILFSGGLDSSLITRLLDLTLPPGLPIDLINLVFDESAPDRKTCLQSISQLRKLSPRTFNLILMNSTIEELELESRQLLTLIYPKDTHMDYNISAVLSTACRMRGVDDRTKVERESMARVVLSGLGADEMFSGYSRYRVAFNRAGFRELEREMNFDLERLWVRNLGRDDRAISAMAKEVRYPFLYAPLVRYLKKEVPFQWLTDFSKPKGQGDKVLLRMVAQELGLKVSSEFKKTAIQFGTRLAKQSNIKNFGSNRKGKGTYTYQKK